MQQVKKKKKKERELLNSFFRQLVSHTFLFQ